MYILYEMIFKTDKTSKGTAIAYLLYISKLRISIIQLYVLVLVTRTGQLTKTDKTSKGTAIAYLFYTSKLRISIIQVYVLVLVTRTGQLTCLMC